MTPTELEAYDAMMRDRDRWRERAEAIERAAQDLIQAKGRHNTKKAYKAPEDAMEGKE
jgi:hypothetical protein